MKVSEKHRTLARAQPLTFRVFEGIFRLIQAGPEPILLEALAPGRPENEQVEIAFAWAEQENLLADLAERIVRTAPTSAFRQACIDTGIALAKELQSIADADNGVLDSNVLAANLSSGSEQVCMVLIDGAPRGTGFLVGPTLVATAFHVIDSLLDENPKGTFTERKDSNKQLSFAFGNYLVRFAGTTRQATPNYYPAHEKWLAAYSPVHPAERLGKTPDPLSLYAGHFDFALCRLATMVGIGLAGLEIEETLGLGDMSRQIAILQHALGSPLSYQRNAAAQTDAPRWRVSHLINTASGSSGAPCLTDNWRVIAMHQAGVNNGSSTASAGTTTNRCVPISWTVDLVRNARLNDVGLLPIAKLDDGEPAIGRSAVSNWIFASLNDPNEPHVFAVVGKASRGKTFTGRLIRSLLPIADHKVVILNTRDFEGLDSFDALTVLWNACGFPINAMPEEDEPLTTKAAFLRHKVVTAFLERLLDKAGPKSTWIVLDDYDEDRLDREPGGSWDLMNHLMRRAGPASRLRFALLGYEASSSTEGAGIKMRSETLAPPTGRDFEVFMRLNGMTAQSEPVMEMLRAMFSKIIQSLPFDTTFYDKLGDIFWRDWSRR